MERVLDSSHNGLIGSRYRTESIGGEMRLRSEVGKGTQVLFRLPKAGRNTAGDSRRPTQPGRPRPTTPPKAAPARPAIFRDATVRSSLRSAFTESSFDSADDSGDAKLRRTP
jgi:hypothetical protein